MKRMVTLGALLVVALVGARLPPALAGAQDTLSALCTSGGQTAPCLSSHWYTSAVSVSWASSPAPISACPAVSYDENVMTTVSCEATWSDGESQQVSLLLDVEVSAPTVRATVSRPPDHRGWYTRPVTVSFSGTSFSGIVGCTPVSEYSGPDAARATISGTCTDAAGQAGTTAVLIHYDATAPRPVLRAAAGDGVVALRWRTTDVAPLTHAVLVRSGGGRGRTLMSGRGRAFRDTTVADGVRYRYTVRLTDQAGQVSTAAVSVTPGPRLLGPAQDAVLRAPPLLSWTPVIGATYYNVQLFRGGKLLSSWPTRARLRLARAWRFAGRRQLLAPGRYRWYVWPGFGALAQARYGRLIGSRTFTIR